MDVLNKNGALDLSFTPVFMKKNRPAYSISVMCKKEDSERLIRLIFEHTTTIGLRKTYADRVIMDRQFEKRRTKYGEITVKVCTYGDIVKEYPEYEDIKALAVRHNISISEILSGLCKNI